MLGREPSQVASPGTYDHKHVDRIGGIKHCVAYGPGILGMDISEIAPIRGFVAPQFCIARLMYRILGRVKAGRRVY